MFQTSKENNQLTLSWCQYHIQLNETYKIGKQESIGNELAKFEKVSERFCYIYFELSKYNFCKYSTQFYNFILVFMVMKNFLYIENKIIEFT